MSNRAFVFSRARSFNLLTVPEKPERIEALLMVMTCSLMIYAALEHRIRQGLVEQNRSVADMKKKPTQQPTARWIFCALVASMNIDWELRHK